MTSNLKRPLGVYIHIPFCRARCLYCRFPARPAGTFTQTQYTENLCGEINKWFSSNSDWVIKTAYIGGGTPSTLSSADIELLLKSIKKLGPEISEFTFEANPHPDDIKKLKVLKENGVNRLSIGVQSFIDSELADAGRLHTAEETMQFILEARIAGFDNLSFDLIHGLPAQTIESFRQSLDEAITYSPEHISLYGLIIEPDSRLGGLPAAVMASLNIPDGDTQAEMYDVAREFLTKAGYIQYEIASFAKPGYECTHNLYYWSGIEYIGFGPGAASYIGDARFRRIYDVNQYITALNEGKNTVDYLESLSSDRAAAEAIVMGLRRTEGINRKSIETKFGIKLTDLCGDVLTKYADEGLLEVSDDQIKLKDHAYYLSDAIFRDIIR